MKNARDYLCKIYLDWRNNYLTIDRFAEHNGLTVNEAQSLINLSREVFSHEHPES